MNTKTVTRPCWSTSSFGHTADATPMELTALGEHLSLCQALTGRLFDLHCGAEAVHAFVASRFVTSLVVLGVLLIGIGLMAS